MKMQEIESFIVRKLPIDSGKKNVLNRRINKLKRDPKGFFQSSYKKRSAQILSKTPIKHRGDNKFTVVSAVYNVEKYLDDYFKSLVNQSLSFKKHIQLILVDDGSTDNSAEIIKKWQRKYPNNITYLYKKNGGIASARNLGLSSVKTEWVTFIDSDDFVSSNYFKIIDDAITEGEDVKLVVANLMFYYEQNKTIQDSHPLKYRFTDKRSTVPLSRLDNNINLFVTVTFFKIDHIKKINLVFDENIKPNFEDGKFIADYLLGLERGNAIYLKDAVFYYRKRGDGSSTIDNSWQNKGKFHDVLKFGYIPMLRDYKNRYGVVPKNIQFTVIYEMSWHLHNFVNKNDKLYFLDEEDKVIYLNLIKDIFGYLDEETIMSFHLNKFWFFYKVGVLGAFKKSEPPFQIAYIEKIDEIKKKVLVTLFAYNEVPMSIAINNIDKIPCHNKVVINSFASEIFSHEYRNWISYNDLKDILNVKLLDQSVKISLKGKLYNNGVSVNEIRNAFKPSKQYSLDGSWLFMDRETKADDNAEHFYRYITRNYPEQKCYFALNKSSKDWQRLEKDGFNLLDFGSDSFEKQLRKASKIVSSHLEAHINNYFGDNYGFSKDFIFLQHGVIKHDLSTWINTKKNINVFVTTTIDEYKSIAKSPSTYKITEKEVVLTGLPRHDALLNNYLEPEKVILIMPTWRHYLVGESIGKGVNTRSLNSNFFNSEYAKNWISLLNNASLHKLVSNYNYRIVFAPHSNIAPYLPFFDLPDYIELWSSLDSEQSIQHLFKQVSFLVTDYSSVAFEMGVLNKATVYYQFDRDEMFSGEHTVQRGYFSYEKDGFGPVVTKESDLLVELENVLKNDGKPLEPYKTRMIETFPFRDGKNCERVYEAILDLDRPDTSVTSVEKIMEYVEKAVTHEAWDLALERIGNALQHSDITQAQVKEVTQIKESVLQTGYQNEPVKLANILWQESRIEEALDVLKQIDDIEASDELLRLRVKLAILNNDFVLARDSQKLLLENYNEQCTTEDWQFYTQLANI
ncbi:CDP-glycerol glycerophosphotransferase family protein [Psychrobacter sp. HII-4]|uniref:CDP-glycerol glycerophosphotransferase family protein n=1 Tax=Psychrobacter sp. HII-4 TaxID=1569264 RepID=UPI00191A2849|nr:CDP-glycerol glycerophosphotransferase family protein [Psychrobacter sp. HII-4]